MAYSLKPGRGVESEVARIVEKQLTLAAAELRGTGDRRRDAAVHEARRHIKKIRAVLHLVQPALGDSYYPATRHIRAAHRLLGPIADGLAVVDTTTKLRRRYGTLFARRTLDSIRVVLVERAARIDRKATLDRVLPSAAALLIAERRRLAGWRLNARGFHAVTPGLERSFRRARAAMRRAAVHRTPEDFHQWRQLVKDLWYEVRLLNERCGGRLAPDERRLEQLDGVLGDYHNVVLIEQILTTEALVSRQAAADALRLLRHDQGALRRRAFVLGATVFSEKPKRFVRRVKHLWTAADAARGPARRPRPWPRAA